MSFQRTECEQSVSSLYDAVCVKGAFEDAHRLRLWQAAEGSATYGDSMLFLKCVTDRGGSERTETI